MSKKAITPEFRIGEETESWKFGSVIVKDVFFSGTGPWFCYRVEKKGNPLESFLASEEELFPEQEEIPEL